MKVLVTTRGDGAIITLTRGYLQYIKLDRINAFKNENVMKCGGGWGEISQQGQEDLGSVCVCVCVCVKDDMKLLGLQPEWAIFRDIIFKNGGTSYMGQMSNPSLAWNRWTF